MSKIGKLQKFKSIQKNIKLLTEHQMVLGRQLEMLIIQNDMIKYNIKYEEYEKNEIMLSNAYTESREEYKRWKKILDDNDEYMDNHQC